MNEFHIYIYATDSSSRLTVYNTGCINDKPLSSWSMNDYTPSLTGHVVTFLILTASSVMISMSSVDKLRLKGSHCVRALSSWFRDNVYCNNNSLSAPVR